MVYRGKCEIRGPKQEKTSADLFRVFSVFRGYCLSSFLAAVPASKNLRSWLFENVAKKTLTTIAVHVGEDR
jgi:hypothetical protein